jgi:ParB-like chromosome segregation protein Spo0J
MEHLKIEYLPLDALKPYERNAKEHPREQIEQIKESIRQMGMNDPIGIWGEECLIVEGHGRLLALQELGYAEAPTIRLDHLTDEQRRAYTLIHNKTTMNSGFDFEMLNAELDDLDIDMGDFGFVNVDDIDVDSFFDESAPKETKEDEEKEIKCPHCGMYFKAG